MPATNDDAASASANRFLWPGPCLLVPITFEALVVTTKSQELAWQFAANAYNLMEFFDNIEPLPFSNTTARPKLGVTLHWSLPDAVTHGTEDAGGAIEYPPVPNRWLIARSHEDPERPGVMVIKAWVVQSDFLDPRLGTSLFPDPKSATHGYTRIGNSVVQEQWTGEAKPGADFVLTAIGPADATFSASVANIRNVFSFQDPLEGFDSGPLTYFTYVVTGWYSDPNRDPLFGAGGTPWSTKAEWLKLMEELKWSVGGDDDLDNALADAKAWYQTHDPEYPWTGDRNKYPAQTVCHGMVYRVKWEGIAGKAPSGVPLGNDPIPIVAVGNTAIDALAAMVQHFERPSEDCRGHSDIAELLQAFQYDLLSIYKTSDRPEELAQAIVNAWFGSVPGGVLWQIVEPDVPAPLITPEQAEMLASLNSLERELDGLKHELTSLQWELHALWWKVNLFTHSAQPPSGITLAQLKALLEQAKPEVMVLLTEKIPKAKVDISALEGRLRASLPANQSLVETTAPRFPLPNEPVVLVYGAHRSYKHGEDRRFSDDDTLFTRFTGQTIDGLEVQAVDGTKILLTASDLGWSPGLPNPQLIPKEVFDLLVESFFLNTAAANFIASTASSALGKPVDPKRIERQQTIIWNPDLHTPLDRRSIAELSGLRGTIPSKVSVDLWKPPWSPLYLQWQVTWHPSSRTTVDALKNWKFDGLEYQWNSGSPDVSLSVSFMGRTLLTPKASDDFGFRLKQFITDYELGRLGNSPLLDLLIPRLKDLLDRAIKWDLLSQCLSGFNDYLVMRNPTMHAKPDDDIARLTGASIESTPNPLKPLSAVLLKTASLEEVTELIQILSSGPAQEEQANGALAVDPFVAFFPIRSGHFQLQRLWIVDDFGQVFNGIGDPGVSPPIRGEGMCTIGNRKLLQLPPRLAQPSRLLFEQVWAESDDRDTSIDPTANPVCGWLLPNHLDRGLTIYDTGGRMLGSLGLVGNPGNLRLRWNPAPGSADPVGAPPGIPNRHVEGFVLSILARTDAAAAFQDLLDVIDSTLWTSNPWEAGTDQNLSVLIGRPIAVVRARLEYQLFGRPVYDQGWAASGKRDTHGYEKIDFPVKLGSLQLSNDGLLGHFLENDYRRFSAVHRLQTPRSNYIVNEDVKINFGSRCEAFITMVLDPRGVAHAANGIMPVKETRLSPAYVDAPLSQMEVTFRTGPLMTDPGTIRMPTPADIRGKWSWIQRSGVVLWNEPAEIINTGQQARLDDAPAEFVDGWLKLSEALGDRTSTLEKDK
jgi:hypothetical protein